MQSDSKGAYQPSLSCGFLVRIRDTLRLQSLLADKKAVGIVLAPFHPWCVIELGISGPPLKKCPCRQLDGTFTAPRCVSETIIDALLISTYLFYQPESDYLTITVV